MGRACGAFDGRWKGADVNPILRNLLVSVGGILLGLAIAIALALLVGYFRGTGSGVITFVVSFGLIAGYFAARSKAETGHY